MVAMYGSNAHTLTHSPTHPPTHPLTHSLTHSLIHSFTHSRTHALTHPLSHSLTDAPTHSLKFMLTGSNCLCSVNPCLPDKTPSTAQTPRLTRPYDTVHGAANGRPRRGCYPDHGDNGTAVPACTHPYLWSADIV